MFHVKHRKEIPTLTYEEVIERLVFIREHYSLKTKERVALNYAIMAIKTLIDFNKKGN